MAERPKTLEIEADLQPGEELFGIIVGTDEGARVVWTPRFLNLPRDQRLQIGELLRMSVDLVPTPGPLQ